MKIWLLDFEHRSDCDKNVTEGYKDLAKANRRVAEIAAEHTEEEEVSQAYFRKDYKEAVDLFVAECEHGADHRLRLVEIEVY